MSMPFNCPKCQSTVRVDTGHLPTGGQARVTCPSCQEAFTVTADPAAAAASNADPGFAAWLRQELDSHKAEVLREVQSMTSGASVGSLAAGAKVDRLKTALICEDDKTFAAVLIDTVKKLGFEPEHVGDVEAAKRSLAVREYGLVTVDGHIVDDEEGGIKILGFINGLPGPRRRGMFVAFISANLKTMDTGSAFIHGANLTVNKEDAPCLQEILAKGMNERDELYRVYDEVTVSVASGE